ncbi:MAG: EamA family transporter [Actinomycetota bacterium]|nr:EamA family transporter [Actinomycetota bacterium]
MTAAAVPASRSFHLVTLGLVVAIAALIGLNYTAMKEALEHTTPLSLAALRTSVGGPVLLAFALVRRERLPRTREQWVAIWWISLSITTISSAMLVAGVSRVSAGVAGMLSATMPLFTAVIAVWVLRERPNRVGAIGVGLGFVGAVVLAVPAFDSGNTVIGVLFILGAALTWAVGGVLNKRLPAALEVSPIMLVAVQILMSCVCLHVLALIIDDWGDTDFGVGLYLPLLYAGIPALSVSFALFATVLRRAPAIQASASAYLTPVFGVAFGWMLRDERFGLVELVGGALVVLGVLVLSFSGRWGSVTPGPATERS